MDAYSALPAQVPETSTACARQTGRGAVRTALLLGALADALFRDSGPIGLALPLWIAVLVLNTVWLTWTAERSVSREVAGWLTSAFLFACAHAWRAAETLQFFDFVAVLLSLSMAAI